MIGVVNFSSAATAPANWSTILATFHKRMGDSEAVLKEQSPLFKAD
jgi:hypothetical protein